MNKVVLQLLYMDACSHFTVYHNIDLSIKITIDCDVTKKLFSYYGDSYFHQSERSKKANGNMIFSVEHSSAKKKC